MDKAKLAIVSVCYNNADELHRTVKSIALQTVEPDAYLIVDSSDEATKSRMEAICSDAATQYVWTPPHGTYNAMNRALRLLPKSSYVWFVNSSDWLSSPQSLAMVRQAVSASEAPTRDWLVGGLFRGLPSQLTTHNIGMHSERFVSRLRSGAIGFPHPSAVTPVEAVLSLGGFDEHYKIAADYDLALRLIRAIGGPKLLDFPVSYHAPGGISYSHPIRDFSEKWLARLRNLPPQEAILSTLLSVVYGIQGAAKRVGLLTEPAPIGRYLDFFDDPLHHFCGSRNQAWPLCCTAFLDKGAKKNPTTKPNPAPTDAK